jgi:hypothetical protein
MSTRWRECSKHDTGTVITITVIYCYILSFFFLFGSIRVLTRGLVLARQALYHLRHSASAFFYS